MSLCTPVTLQATGLTALRAVSSTCTRPVLFSTAHFLVQQHTLKTAARQFSTTHAVRNLVLSKGQEKVLSKEQIQEIKFKEESWPHPVYSPEQMSAIKIAHRQCKDWSDWVALSAVRLLRTSYDLATGYRHPKKLPNGEEKPVMFKMTPERWLARFIFLESVAGVFGMVGGAIRHLHSLRRLRRDNGWIESLLEEAYNERMHLLTFLKLRTPGLFMRLAILGAQGVVYNGFFLAYLISPKTCHRFVGYLEEEAVITYTRAIEDLEAGKLKEWETLQAPDIAKNYWKMGENATMKDLLYYVRADEAKHREVNHTLANLHQDDFNPYKEIEGGVAATSDGQGIKPQMVRPSKDLNSSVSNPIGFEREQVLHHAPNVMHA